MFYVFLLVLAVLGVGIYLLFFFSNVPGATEERLGVLEPLPPDLGKWKDDLSSDLAKQAQTQGLRREVRTFFDEGRGCLLAQARYRSLETNQIVRSDPDLILKRRRVRQ